MKKIMHVLEHSLPRLSGYTIRSKYIVENQIKSGWNNIVMTSPLQGKTNKEPNEYEKIDGVRYYRTGKFNRLDMKKPLPIRLIQRYQYSAGYLKSIQMIGKKESVNIIHAHSSYLNGIRANAASKALKIPSIYEVRGLWQDTAAVNESIGSLNWKYLFVEFMDRKAMLGADRVVTISDRLKEELVRKKIPEDSIYVVPNGVDTNKFSPKPKEKSLLGKYNLEDKIVFGFIGSIRRIEGLSLFLKNFPQIYKKNNNARVLLVGDGDEVNNLKNIAQDSGLADKIVFTGRVDHEQILDYYSLMDVLIYPRINSKVNKKVTPLKPLEAMAMEKVVLGSNVGGLVELIHEGKNGFLFNVDDGMDLVAKCYDLLENYSKFNAYGKKAREWTVKNRDWGKVIKNYDRIYRELID